MPALIAASMMFASIAMAVDPDEMLSDPAKEQRARGLSSELRCLVCQNQSIDESDATLARDLRLIVRQRIEAGDDDEAIRQYLVQRYGEFVLLRPRFSSRTALLWTLPFLALLGGALLASRVFRSAQARPVNEAQLRPDEKSRLDHLLKSESSSDS